MAGRKEGLNVYYSVRDATVFRLLDVAKEIFNIKKVVCRIYDPIRESTYNELGLETYCPTIIGAQTLFDALSSDKQEQQTEKG